MHILLIFLLIPLSIAAPTSSSLVHVSNHTSHHIHPTVPHSISHPTFTTRSRDPHTFSPAHTASSGSRFKHRANQQALNIVFEVLGGILATGILFGFLRCFYNYRKTPQRDRIADILHRHHLQRELEELERNPVALRRPSLREPAPPYFPRPPSYEHMNPTQQGTLPPRVDYSAVPTHSPPASPPMSQRIPLPTHAVTARLLPGLIPPRPSG